MESHRNLIEPEVAGAQDTIYLCNFRVSVEGEWLCLKELQDCDFSMQESIIQQQQQKQQQFLRGSSIHPMGRDPVSIERSNLVNITKLVVKALIQQSLRYGRMLDSDHLPLQHFFIVLEHVLRHGLRLKKGLLGHSGAQELWDLLQTVEKFAPEAQDITASVRDLPTVRTHMGRARAWLRLALMQKKLADYLKVLIDYRDEVLFEYFEADALMMNDEAIIIIGLLLGLNVIDCNLCVKEEDLDCPQGVIDFSLYLRTSPDGSTADECTITSEGNGINSGTVVGDQMTTVLDQKNYIEELNRHLNATVTNLHAKVESLTTMNALLKEDLSITNTSLLAITEENHQLRLELGHDLDLLPPSTMPLKNATCSQKTNINNQEEMSSKVSLRSRIDSSQESSTTEEVLRQRLDEEQRKRQESVKELELQTCMKAEMEVAMKLLEKDIHEKQDTIVSLRRQLDDIKSINLEMYRKLQECEPSLKHRTELVAKLEAKAQSMSDALQAIETKYKDSELQRVKAEMKRHELNTQVSQNEKLTTRVENDLRVEREWRTSLEQSREQDKQRILQSQTEMNHLRAIAKKYSILQEDYYALKERSLEQEQTLEELGAQLSISKLKISDLKEEAAAAASSAISSSNLGGSSSTSQWTIDSAVRSCQLCNKEFNLTRRRHHCRYCGGIFCNSCSEFSAGLPSASKPVRVCETCHKILTGD